MIVRVDIKIDRSKESVWRAITDIENWQSMISSIMKIDILNKPERRTLLVRSGKKQGRCSEKRRWKLCGSLIRR